MRQFFLFLSLALLTSCGDTPQDMRMGMFYAEGIPVDSFEQFWNMADEGSDVKGTWHAIGANESVIGPDLWRVYDDNNLYEFQSYIFGYGIYETDYLKTLDGGQYKFLIIRCSEKPGGYLYRYVIINDVLTVYKLNVGPTLLWLRKKYPLAENIGAGDYGEYDPLEVKMTFVRIKSFDKHVLTILSDIPDNEVYWKVGSQYKKTRVMVQ